MDPVTDTVAAIVAAPVTSSPASPAADPLANSITLALGGPGGTAVTIPLERARQLCPNEVEAMDDAARCVAEAEAELKQANQAHVNAIVALYHALARVAYTQLGLSPTHPIVTCVETLEALRVLA